MIIYIFSIILGLIIGGIIGYFAFIRNDYHGPNSNEIKKYIYKINDKYYKFDTKVCICPLGNCVKNKKKIHK